MVKVLIAPDKFKGSLTAAQVCEAVNNFLSIEGKYSVTMLPLADGGEGTFEILSQHFHGITHEVIVHDPLMRKIKATYGLSADGETAFIEMAKASGLQLLKSEERNPLATTTFGTGELIVDALQRKVKAIILGIGGSATNDAGIGMASALGYRFYTDAATQFNPLGGSALSKVMRIDRSQVNPLLNNVKFITLCDVKNPLTGSHGAARIFSPQKGASPSAVVTLENGMLHFEKILKSTYGFSAEFEGAGAAGGLGAGSCFFLNAEIVKGMDFISSVTNLESKISESDIIITGEGKLDVQSLSGKVVQRVTQLAKKHNKKVMAICGVLELDKQQLSYLGLDECHTLSDGKNVENAIINAVSLIQARLQESTILTSSTL